MRVRAWRLDQEDLSATRLPIAAIDIKEPRLEKRILDHLVQGEVVLQQKVQHRVANSFQIIASILPPNA